jgi:hypothetical protein
MTPFYHIVFLAVNTFLQFMGLFLTLKRIFGLASFAQLYQISRKYWDNNMTKDTKSMMYDPTNSVLKYKIGDEIKLQEVDFELLFKAFFSEMERKFVK